MTTHPSPELKREPEESTSDTLQVGSPRFMLVKTAIISAVVTTICLSIYDVRVRQPRTPHFGTVDVSELFAANEGRILQQQIFSAVASGTAIDTKRLGQEAGNQMTQQLKDFSERCGCVLIAAPAVFGQSAVVPDYTSAVKRTFALAAPKVAPNEYAEALRGMGAKSAEPADANRQAAASAAH